MRMKEVALIVVILRKLFTDKLTAITCLELQPPSLTGPSMINTFTTSYLQTVRKLMVAPTWILPTRRLTRLDSPILFERKIQRVPNCPGNPELRKFADLQRIKSVKSKCEKRHKFASNCLYKQCFTVIAHKRLEDHCPSYTDLDFLVSQNNWVLLYDRHHW